MGNVVHSNAATLRGAILVGLAFAILSVGLVFPFEIWLLELFEAFAVQFLLIWIVAAVILVIQRRWLLFLGASITVFVLSFHTYRYFPFSGGSKHHESELRIGAFNVFYHNKDHRGCADAIISSKVGVACVFEVGHGWSNALETMMQVDFPYMVQVPRKECCWGIALFSRYPIISDSVFWFTRDPVIMATVATSNGEVDVWAVHTRPPIFPNDTEERNELMMMVGKEIASRGRPAILAGDLNIVPWAADFRRMAKLAELMDTRQGFKPTFPADLGIPLIPIDHVLHSRHFRFGSTRTVKLPGSDHRGFIASISWIERQK
jgi:endonuclease/exonuclease/phosphatase (EEP) superfamily protein YafD